MWVFGDAASSVGEVSVVGTRRRVEAAMGAARLSAARHTGRFVA